MAYHEGPVDLDIRDVDPADPKALLGCLSSENLAINSAAIGRIQEHGWKQCQAANPMGLYGVYNPEGLFKTLEANLGDPLANPKTAFNGVSRKAEVMGPSHIASLTLTPGATNG